MIVNLGCSRTVGSSPHGTACKILKDPSTPSSDEEQPDAVTKAIIGPCFASCNWCSRVHRLETAVAQYWVTIGQYWVSIVKTGNPTGLYQLLILSSNTANSTSNPPV